MEAGVEKVSKHQHRQDENGVRHGHGKMEPRKGNLEELKKRACVQLSKEFGKVLERTVTKPRTMSEYRRVVAMDLIQRKNRKK